MRHKLWSDGAGRDYLIQEVNQANHITLYKVIH